MSYTFSLLAPNNREASVSGTFSDWKDCPMARGPDGIFRFEVALADGAYDYVYKVRSRSWFLEQDSWVTIVDPHATEINPSGDHGIVRLAHGHKVIDDYTWSNDDKPLPSNEELIIYELHVGDFTERSHGKFSDLHSRLDYLVDLGINAVELMPVAANPGPYSWGYNPRHFFAVDPDYGGPKDLKQWIDACHGRGIRVLLDMVLNHAEASSPLTQIDHDYWFRHEPKDKQFNWGPEFNYEFWDSQLDLWPARQFAVDVVDFWVREYHLDGLRFDGVKQLDNHDALRAMNEAAHRGASPRPFFSIAECVPEDPTVTNFEGPLDSAWHDSFCHVVVDLLTEQAYDMAQLRRVLDGRQMGYSAAVNMVNYCTNHDHNHLLADLAHHGYLDGTAWCKVHQGAVLCFTAVGIPMLWMGEEVGEYHDRSDKAAKVQWSLLGGRENQALLQFYRDLVRLRRAHASLRSDTIEFIFEHVDHRVLAYRRGNIMVVVHLADGEVEVDIPSWPDGTWQPALLGADQIAGPGWKGSLPAYETRVYVADTTVG